MRLGWISRRWRRGTLRGRRGTYGTGLALVARLGWSSRRWRCGTLRGRRGTWRHPPSFEVAGVALGDIYLRFAWPAWHLATSAFAWRHPPLFCVAGSGGSRRWRRGTLRGRRGTWRHPPSFHVAGVAFGDIHLRFAWQAWHLATSAFVSRGRCGIWWHPPSFCVVGVALRALPSLCLAGVALGDIRLRFTWQVWHFYLRFAWQAWHLRHYLRFAWQALQAWHLVTSTFVSRGRRGTWWMSHALFHTQLSHTPSFTHNFVTHTH